MNQKQQQQSTYKQSTTNYSDSSSSRGGFRGGRGGRGGYSNYDGGDRNSNYNDKGGHYYNNKQRDNYDGYNKDGNSSYRDGNNQRGGRGGYGQNGRGSHDNYHHSDRHDDKKATQKPTQTQTSTTIQAKPSDLKQTSKGLFSSEFDKAFGPKTTTTDETQQTPTTTTQGTENDSQTLQNTTINEQNNQLQGQSVETQQQQPVDISVQETNGTSSNFQGKQMHQNGDYDKHKNTHKPQKHDQDHQQQKYHQHNDRQNKQYDGRFKNYQEKRDFQKKQQQQQEDSKTTSSTYKDAQNDEESNVLAESEKNKTNQQESQKVEEEKKTVRVDFVPDPNFSWSLDLEGTMSKGKKKKKSKDGAPNLEMPFVIQSSAPTKSVLKENIKMKLSENLEFSTIHIDKLNKGLTNTTNCCFMNVILQSLLSIPAFYNMLVAISENQDVMKELGPESLLRKFVYLSLYFNPTQQMDRKSPFAANPVDAEKIFAELNQNFNPYQEHQDCHEFLALLLDMLHDELKLIYVPNDDKDNEGVVDEWQEVGRKNATCKFNNDQQNISQSLIRDIFGGHVRNEFQVDRSSNVSVTYEPFFVLNLEVNRSETLEECMNQFFKAKPLNDYKIDGKLVRATHQQQIDKLPNILILQLKRFVYRDGPIKIGDYVEFPDVLRIEDNCLSTHLKLGTFNKEERDEKGRSYRLTSIVIHKGNQLSRGHYICYVLDASNNWIQYDDNKIKKMIDTDSVFDSQAYLLFYELII